MTAKKSNSATDVPEPAAAEPKPAAKKGRQAPVRITVGNYPFKIDVSEIAFKTVGQSQNKVNGKPYLVGRLFLPAEWIGKSVIILAVDEGDDTNRESIAGIQKEGQE